MLSILCIAPEAEEKRCEFEWSVFVSDEMQSIVCILPQLGISIRMGYFRMSPIFPGSNLSITQTSDTLPKSHWTVFLTSESNALCLDLFSATFLHDLHEIDRS